MKSSDKTRSTRGGNGKPHQYSDLKNSMNSMKRKYVCDDGQEFSKQIKIRQATESRCRIEAKQKEQIKPARNIMQNRNEENVKATRERLAIFKEAMRRTVDFLICIMRVRRQWDGRSTG